MSKTRVIIADDHPVVLAGLGLLIGAEADLEIVGEAGSGPVALNLIRQENPDIAIVDISLPGLNGIAIARQIAQDRLPVGIIMLTQHDDPAHLGQSLDAGVRGYVLKQSAAQCLVNAVRGVLVGGLYVDPTMVAHMFPPGSAARPSMTAKRSLLTERELQVLRYVAAGLTGKEIAARLDLSLSSVETYRTRASGKLGIKSRADIVRYASTQGWMASF